MGTAWALHDGQGPGGLGAEEHGSVDGRAGWCTPQPDRAADRAQTQEDPS
jgi:hypothetical protein